MEIPYNLFLSIFQKNPNALVGVTVYLDKENQDSYHDPLKFINQNCDFSISFSETQASRLLFKIKAINN